jgi:uncharacterized protein YndB with AHSA1/START domain
MDSEVAALVGAVQRRVETVQRDGRPAKVALAIRTYDARIDDVWDALTSPDRLPRWFAPVTGDLRMGGRYQVQGNAGGLVEQCDPPHALAVTWEFGGETSWLDVRLVESASGTTLELRHTAHVEAERWVEFGPGAVGVGWDLALYGLHLHLSTGQAVDPQAAEAWSISPEGAAFITGCSDGWTQAAIADGDSESDAVAAGARTTAFYTGQPPAGA